MTDLPYTYTDRDDDSIAVGVDHLVTTSGTVRTPTGADAAAFARAVLAAAGDTGHVVLSRDELTAMRRADARSMRERAMRAASDAPGTPYTPTEAIRALPLLPDSDADEARPVYETPEELAAEIEQLRTALKTAEAQNDNPAPESDAAYDQVMEERDTAQEWADKLAAALAPSGARGEHSNANNPWQNALDYAAGATATVHVATPEGITPCGEGHPDVTVSAIIPEVSCVECLRAIALEKSGQIIEIQHERDRYRTAWQSARRDRTDAREQFADARRWGRILEAQWADLRNKLRAAEARLPEDDTVETGGQAPSLESRVGALEQQYTDLADLVHGHGEDLTRLRRRFTEEDDG